MFFMNQGPCLPLRQKLLLARWGWVGGLVRHLPADTGTAAGRPPDRRLRSSGSGAESQCGHIAHVTLKIMDRTVLSASVLTAPLGFVVVGQLEVAGTTRRDLLLRLEECYTFWQQSQRLGLILFCSHSSLLKSRWYNQTAVHRAYLGSHSFITKGQSLLMHSYPLKRSFDVQRQWLLPPKGTPDKDNGEFCHGLYFKSILFPGKFFLHNTSETELNSGVTAVTVSHASF